MAERVTLTAQPREVLGKKVKRLRKEGILPANVYGNGIPSLAIQLDSRDFVRKVRSSGVRSMFELAVDGEDRARYVILRGLSRQGGTGDPVHVDFYQVDLRRPIQTTVRVVLEGEAPAVRDLAGTLLQHLETVSVRCLPLDIPDALTADVSALKSFDVSISVADLHAPEGVEILTDPSVSVAAVAAPRIRLTGDEEEGEEGGEEPGAGESGDAGESAQDSGEE